MEKKNNKLLNKDVNDNSKSTEKETKNTKVSSKITKKNQLIIAVLTVLLGIAGYINFQGVSSFDLSDENENQQAFANGDLDEINEKITVADLDIEEVIDDEDLYLDEDNIGEVVLTSADSTKISFANMKLIREQTRSKSKEYYMDIINKEGNDKDTVQSATDAYIRLTENMEKEAEAETILCAKGFAGAIVSIGDENVDVVISAKKLDDTERAQIEDIVVRKTGCSVEKINISTVTE